MFLRSLRAVKLSANAGVRHYGRTSVVAAPMNLSKIVATIGPASEEIEMLPQIVDAGMRIMRINFSHATYEEADLRMKNLALSPGLTSKNFNLRAVMLDTQGPEIRTGSFGTDGKVELVKGDNVTLTTDESFRHTQTKDKLWISYPQLMETLSIGSVVLLDDGAVELSVLEKNESNGEMVCRVVNSGTLGSRKGVNLPNAKVQLPAMSDKDRQDIRWGIENDIDYIAVSFVRKAQDLQDIRTFVNGLMKEFHPPNHPHPRLIAKIESTEAMENFDEILAETDGVMVARGDLGVEIPLETLANAQKEIVRKSNLSGKPVIVATQMLESMQKNPRPTRAECTDVANAIFDGADCVMLSGESAKGQYPVGAVEMMNKIIGNAEQWGAEHDVSLVPMPEFEDSAEAIAVGAVEAAKSLNASCIIAVSQSGGVAQALSKFRPDAPILAYVPTAKIGKLMQMYRGIHPIMLEDAAHQQLIRSGAQEKYSVLVQKALDLGFCNKGDKVVIVCAEEGAANLSTSLSLRIATAL